MAPGDNLISSIATSRHLLSLIDSSLHSLPAKFKVCAESCLHHPSLMICGRTTSFMLLSIQPSSSIHTSPGLAGMSENINTDNLTISSRMVSTTIYKKKKILTQFSYSEGSEIRVTIKEQLKEHFTITDQIKKFFTRNAE